MHIYKNYDRELRLLLKSTWKIQISAVYLHVLKIHFL